MIGAVVQARMSSARLPGKVLAPVQGKPLLGYLLERLEHHPYLDAVVVATSQDSGDDPVANYCRTQGVACHRGPLENVAKRVLDAAERFGLDAFVRVCGDSPLLDPALVTEAVEMFRKGDYDLVTNVLPRTFPKGQSVEVLATAPFAKVCRGLATSEAQEHITAHYYTHASNFRILNFESGEEMGMVQLSVDTAEDMAHFQALVDAMDKPHREYGWRELIDLLDVTAITGGGYGRA